MSNSSAAEAMWVSMHMLAAAQRASAARSFCHIGLGAAVARGIVERGRPVHHQLAARICE